MTRFWWRCRACKYRLRHGWTHWLTVDAEAKAKAITVLLVDGQRLFSIAMLGSPWRCPNRSSAFTDGGVVDRHRTDSVDCSGKHQDQQTE